MKLHHGGDTSWAKETFSYEGDDWLDLSTGINQCPYPIPEIPADAYHRLPEKHLLQSLKKAAASYYGMNDTAKLAAASGSQSLIQWVARLRAPGKTAILTPTYQEHAHSWFQAGHDVYEDASLDRLLSHQPDVLVIVQPNNPTGLTLNEDELLALADQMNARGGWLILDEAFGDVIPDQCLDKHAGRPGLILLRSFGKFFGLAGVRLGIATGPNTFIEDLERAMGPWSVPGPTLEVALRAYQDQNWIRETRLRLADDAMRMDQILRQTGAECLGGTHLFRLITHPEAPALMQHLGNHGIMIRHFEYAPNWLRFGLPYGENEWSRLEQAIASFQA